MFFPVLDYFFRSDPADTFLSLAMAPLVQKGPQSISAADVHCLVHGRPCAGISIARSDPPL